MLELTVQYRMIIIKWHYEGMVGLKLMKVTLTVSSLLQYSIRKNGTIKNPAYSDSIRSDNITEITTTYRKIYIDTTKYETVVLYL